MKSVFITGSTGFLGGEVLIELSKRKEIDSIYCLIRADSQEKASQRLKRIFDLHGDYWDTNKVFAVLGDLTQADLTERLSNDPVLQKIDTIVHSAANTSFSPIYDTVVEQVNIHGLEKILAWSKKLKHLETFLHVGTATICGEEVKNRVVLEEESPNTKASHLVKYTYTKMMAEIMIGKALPAEKILIVRPSIIMGDSRPIIPRSYVIMWALATTNFLRLVPVNPDSQLDIISVDYAASAITHLLFAKRNHRVYHISSGSASATTPLKLALAVENDFPEKPSFHFVGKEMIRDIKLWSKKKLSANSILQNYDTYLNYWKREMKDAGDLRILMAAIEFYYDFMELGQVFDNSKLLQDTTIGSPEPAHEYIKRSALLLNNIDIFEAALEP
jgi:thioester reductase-like protein